MTILSYSTETLTLGEKFNQPLTRVDFKGISTLTLGDKFNQPLTGVDFKGISTLTLGDKFNQPLTGVDFKSVSQIFPSKFRDHLKERYVRFYHYGSGRVVSKRRYVLDTSKTLFVHRDLRCYWEEASLKLKNLPLCRVSLPSVKWVDLPTVDCVICQSDNYIIECKNLRCKRCSNTVCLECYNSLLKIDSMSCPVCRAKPFYLK